MVLVAEEEGAVILAVWLKELYSVLCSTEAAVAADGVAVDLVEVDLAVAALVALVEEVPEEEERAADGNEELMSNDKT